MMKIKLAAVCVITSALVLTGCAAASKDATTKAESTQSSEKTGMEEAGATSTITVKHELGEAKLPINPKKVVVFDMATLDSMNALGVEVEIAAPLASVPSFLEAYQKVTNAGDMKEPNMETIYEFEPDMIIISGRQQEAYQELSKIAPTWFLPTSKPGQLIEDFQTNYEILGKLFGKEAEAKVLIDQTLAKIQEVAKLGANTQEKALIILTNDGTISAYGTGSRFGLIHDALKVPAADENIEASTHGQEVGFEYLAEVDPDILFVVDRNAVVAGNNNAADTLDNELIKQTKAYKNNRIVYLDAEKWYIVGSGLTVLPKMIEEVEAAINR